MTISNKSCSICSIKASGQVPFYIRNQPWWLQICQHHLHREKKKPLAAAVCVPWHWKSYSNRQVEKFKSQCGTILMQVAPLFTKMPLLLFMKTLLKLHFIHKNPKAWVITNFKIIPTPTAAYSPLGFTTCCTDRPMLRFQQPNQGFILFAVPTQAQCSSRISMKSTANKQSSADESMFNMKFSFPKISLGTPKALSDMNKDGLGRRLSLQSWL